MARVGFLMRVWRVTMTNTRRSSSQLRERAQDIVQFLSTLPIGLERADLRVIHAAWQDEQIEAARRLPLGSVRAEYDRWETFIAQQQARETALAKRMARELEQWEHGLENSQRSRRFCTPMPSTNPASDC